MRRFIAPVLGLGLTFGGETLARITFDDETSQKIRAGGLAHLYAGARADIAPGLALRATLGYHEDSANASNLRVTFARVPLELVGQYQLADQYWIGLGLRKSYATRYWARGTATAWRTGAGHRDWDGNRGPPGRVTRGSRRRGCRSRCQPCHACGGASREWTGRR